MTRNLAPYATLLISVRSWKGRRRVKSMAAVALPKQNIGQLPDSALNTALGQRKQEFGRLFEKDSSIICEWDEIWLAFEHFSRQLHSDQSNLAKVRYLQRLKSLSLEFQERYSSQLSTELNEWIQSFLAELEIPSDLYYGLALINGELVDPEIIEKYEGFSGPQQYVVSLFLEGISVISRTVIPFFEWLRVTDLPIEAFRKFCNSMLSDTWVEDLVFKNESEKVITLRLVKSIKVITKSILFDIGEFEQNIKIRSLYPDLDTYEYMERQSDLFDQSLPQLSKEYPGKYVVFEDGNVLDSDNSEDSLLERISDFTQINKFGLNGLFIERVPENV